MIKSKQGDFDLLNNFVNFVKLPVWWRYWRRQI